MAYYATYSEAWKAINDTYEKLYGEGVYLKKISNIIDNEYNSDADAFLRSYFVEVPKNANGTAVCYQLKSEYNQEQNQWKNLGGANLGDVIPDDVSSPAISPSSPAISPSTPNIGSLPNSNLVGSQAAGGSVQGSVVLDVTKDKTTGKTVVNTGMRNYKTDARSDLAMVMNRVTTAVGAAAIGIRLGKRIDKALYNINPDFWDSHNMSTLNPDTWGSITAGKTGPLANLFNMAFGIDPKTGEGQAYIDEDTFAYVTGYLQDKNAFQNSLTSAEASGYKISVNYPFIADNYSGGTIKIGQYSWTIKPSVENQEFKLIGYRWNHEVPSATFVVSSKKEFSYTVPSGSVYTAELVEDIPNHEFWWYETSAVDDVDDTQISPAVNNPNLYSDFDPEPQGTSTPPLDNFDYFSIAAGFIALFGSIVSGLDGISNQPGATQFDPTGVTASDPESVKAALKKQYPDLYDKALVNSQVDPETGKQTDKIYLPVGLPSNVTDPKSDMKPTTDDGAQGNTQENTKINPLEKLNDLTKVLLGWLIPSITPPTTKDPPDTGGGDTPTIVQPVGSASSLWAVYNPTQEQINSFGAWLWSSNFVDQLKKLFNNPMDSIIGLHKVYCPVPVSGSATIKVGYLDSGVSASTVSSQYTTISCGSVNLPEYFGNIFDYSPYTRISCFLPFIGIVPLDVAEVMRSTISIKYHVDVLTGACLAEINVQRDGATANLYTYSGNAAVQYPLSSGSYMGIVSGIASVAGSIGSAIMSGGASTPLSIAGAASGISNAHTTVQHSGSISGNAGAMGGKIPYIIIERPQTHMTDYEHFLGNPEYKKVKVSSCKGFSKFSAIHTDGVSGATEDEKREIENLLKEGVIV